MHGAQLPGRERALRSLLEGLNLRYFELVIHELPRDQVHVIGAYAIRGLVGGFRNHGRFTLDIDAVVNEELIDSVEDVAKVLGMQVIRHEWGIELLKVDPRLGRFYVKLEFGLPDVVEGGKLVLRYDPGLTLVRDLESADGYVVGGVKVQRPEVIIASKLMLRPHIPHDPVDMLALDKAVRLGMVPFDKALLKALISNEAMLMKAQRYIRNYEEMANKGAWYSTYVRRSMETRLYEIIKATVNELVPGH